MNREQLVRLAREAAAGINRPDYNENPPAFDPHEWVLDAMRMAYKAGRTATAEPREQPAPVQNAGPAIVDLVLQDVTDPVVRAFFEARDREGTYFYGTRLQAFNGRDAARDAAEEFADGTNYARQKAEETMGEERERWLDMARAALVLLHHALDRPCPASATGVIDAIRCAVCGADVPVVDAWASLGPGGRGIIHTCSAVACLAKAKAAASTETP